MKKILLLQCLALAAVFANGQTAKSSWLVGGTVGFTSSTEKQSGVSGSSSTTAVALAPSAGYFFINNLAAGVSLNLSSSHSTSAGTTSTTITNFSAGPFVRYYFNTSPKVKIFVHGDASWGSERYDYNYGGNDQSGPGMPISIYDAKAGTAVFLNSSVGLEFTLGYESWILKQSGLKFTTGSVIVGIGFQVYLGPAKK